MVQTDWDPAQAALLLIDLQQGLFQGTHAVTGADALIQRLFKLTTNFARAGYPIWAAQHTGPSMTPLAEGAPAWQLVPEFQQLPIQRFSKTNPSCFNQTNLEVELRKAGVRHLVIAGAKTEYCVDTSCRIAKELGFVPWLVTDGHSTVAESATDAEWVIAHHNKVLGSAFARLIGSQQLDALISNQQR